MTSPDVERAVTRWAGNWRMVRGGRVWHYMVDGRGLCGIVDDEVGMGRFNAPDCIECARLLRSQS